MALERCSFHVNAYVDASDGCDDLLGGAYHKNIFHNHVEENTNDDLAR
jgi:hypothetical protein